MKANAPKRTSNAQINVLMQAYHVTTMKALYDAITKEMAAPITDASLCKRFNLTRSDRTIYCGGTILFMNCTGVDSTDGRRTERKVAYGTWEPIVFENLTSGCTFRMFESTGEPVVDAYGHTAWVAASTPYYNGTGIAKILVY